MAVVDRLAPVLKNQYHASLAMLYDTIAQCPDDLWYSQIPTNAYWQVAYHALFFAHLYLMPGESAFQPWAKHQTNNQNPDGIGGPPDPASTLPLIPSPYCRTDALEYWEFIDDHVDEWFDALDLDAGASGFPWYKTSKLDHQLVNIRHIQHHAAQLADRLRAHSNIGTKWAGAGRRRAV